MIKEEINNNLTKLDKFQHELKKHSEILQKVNLFEVIFIKILELPIEECDEYIPFIVDDLQKKLVGLTWDLGNDRGDMVNLHTVNPKGHSDLIKKLHRIGHNNLSVAKLFLIDQKYISALNTSRSLIYYDEIIIESLDFEAKLIRKRLQNKKEFKKL